MNYIGFIYYLSHLFKNVIYIFFVIYIFSIMLKKVKLWKYFQSTKKHIYYQKVPENQFKLEQLDLIIKLNTLCFDCNGAQPVGAIIQLPYKVH